MQSILEIQSEIADIKQAIQLQLHHMLDLFADNPEVSLGLVLATLNMLYIIRNTDELSLAELIRLYEHNLNFLLANDSTL